MKIAVIAPPLLRVPPGGKNGGYGGLEIVVKDLCEALAKKDHEVTLIAAKGSFAEGCKVFETVVAPERTDVDWPHLESDAFQKYEGVLKDFDTIHDHSWFFFSALAKHANKDLKIVHTHHGHLVWDVNTVPDFVKPVNLVAISQFMVNEYKAQGWESRCAYNGIDLGKYPYYKDKSDRLVFVGRISKFKRPDLAIKAATMANTPIDVVGGSFIEDPAYLEQIKQMCVDSKGLATLHLDLPHAEKVQIVQRAKACLVPSRMAEPYGLTIVEALSCGTPVVAMDDGAIREVLLGDITDPYEGRKRGVVCKTDEQFISTIVHFDTHSNAVPDACRARAEFFSRENMADRYLELYKQAIEGPGW